MKLFNDFQSYQLNFSGCYLDYFKLIIIHFNHFMQFRGNFDNGSKSDRPLSDNHPIPAGRARKSHLPFLFPDGPKAHIHVHPTAYTHRMCYHAHPSISPKNFFHQIL